MRLHPVFSLPPLLVILAAGFTAMADQTHSQSQTPSVIDGSKTPALIPDEDMLALILLTASAPTAGATSEETRRARAFADNLGLPAPDRNLFSAQARAYRAAREQAPAGGPRSDLAQTAIGNLHARLSPAAAAQLTALLQHEKRSVKLFPLPSMTGQAAARTWFERLLAQLFPAVQAQSMGYGRLYTTLTIDFDGAVFATGTTDGQSGCNCHSVTANTTLHLPGGRAAYASANGPGELAQATAYLDMSDVDFADAGQIDAETTHMVYCPFAHADIANAQTGQTNPLISIQAYYFCQPMNGPCAKTPNPLTGESTYTHDRCNPGTVCNRLYSRRNTWPFTLQRVAQISIGGNTVCIADQASAQQRIACDSPDPKP